MCYFRKMGKAKKGKFGKGEGGRGDRNAPLAHQMLEDPTVRAPGRTKVRKRTEDEEQVRTPYYRS